MAGWILCVAAASAGAGEGAGLKWIPLGDERLEVRGLPWYRENAPELWRLPQSAKGKVPSAVWNRAVAPDGGRIRLCSTTTRLEVGVQRAKEAGKPCYVDAFIGPEFAGSVSVVGTGRVDLVLFERKERSRKEITIYLPNNQEMRLFAVGVDGDAELARPAPFARGAPLVCYGSSVLQGTGAAHPAHTYPAALARRLNLDFVNLGFGGAGKAEVEVVALVNQIDACCYLFDLGKSYGAPTPERYERMLDTIRASHPTVPIVCVTPIYSTKEAKEPDYLKKSEDLRTLMRQAATERLRAGDARMHVVEGLALFGEADKNLFRDPLHPTDEGNERMAERLTPMVGKIIFGKEARLLGTNAPPARAR